MHFKAVFTSARFFLTTNISHGTLGLAFCLVGMHSAAAFKWALTKFSYSSFAVCVSDFSCSASNLFLSFNAYSFLISLLLSRDQSLYTVVVRAVFLRRISRIFAVTIWWSEDTRSKEEHISQFKLLKTIKLYAKKRRHYHYQIGIITWNHIIISIWLGT